MKDKFYLSEEDYIKGVSLMVRFCLDFLIIKNDQVLLSKRLFEPFKGFWHLPGGMVKKGELIDEAADRILLSEIGLKPVTKELVGYIESLNEKLPEKGILTHSNSIVFKTTLEKGDIIKESSQAEEIKFFSKIPTDTILPVREFLKKHGGYILRS